jgi:hypothetical protein
MMGGLYYSGDELRNGTVRTMVEELQLGSGKENNSLRVGGITLCMLGESFLGKGRISLMAMNTQACEYRFS